MFRRKSGKDSTGIAILGIQGSGKSTFFYQMVEKKYVETMPTLGCTNEKIKIEDQKIQLVDIGGSPLARQTWSHYIEITDAIIFMVDAADTRSLPQAKHELWKVIFEKFQSDEEDEICSLEQAQDQEQLAKQQLPSVTQQPICVVANKQDLPGALSKSQLRKALGIDQLQFAQPQLRISVVSTNSKTGENSSFVFEWLLKECQSNFPVFEKPRKSGTPSSAQLPVLELSNISLDSKSNEEKNDSFNSKNHSGVNNRESTEELSFSRRRKSSIPSPSTSDVSAGTPKLSGGLSRMLKALADEINAPPPQSTTGKPLTAAERAARSKARNMGLM